MFTMTSKSGGNIAAEVVKILGLPCVSYLRKIPTKTTTI